MAQSPRGKGRASTTGRRQAGARDVCFAGSRVRLEFSGPGAAELVDFLFHEIPEQGRRKPDVTIRLDDSDGRELSFIEDDAAGHQDRGHASEIGSALQERVAFHLADRSRGGLLFHAGAVAWHGGSVLIPGASGAGKTTLTAWLARRGFTFLTDELVYLPFGGRRVQPLTRPLNVKTAGLAALAGCVIDFGATATVLSGKRVTLVAPAALGDGTVDRASDLVAVVFPRFEPGVRMEIEPLSKAETATRLMGGLVNARNLPEEGFAEVARLVREVPAWRLTYGAFDQIERWADSLKRSLA